MSDGNHPVEHPADVPYEARTMELLGKSPLLAEKIASATGVDPVAAERLLSEVLRFLQLVAWSGKTLAPAKQLDDAWHEFILFTSEYAGYCQQYLGRFIHHRPGRPDDTHTHRLRQTIRLYDLVFHQPPPALWGLSPDLLVSLV